MANIWLDSNEPEALRRLLSTGFTVTVDDLNLKGFADILWHGVTSMEQLERKQCGEFLGDLDGHMAQIRREVELGVADQLYVAVEGMPYPSGPNEVTSYQMSKDNRMMFPGKKFRYSYRRVMGWIASLESVGVPVFFVPNLSGLVELVTVLYNRAQGEREDPFSRYIKPRPTIKAWNPYVLTLMGVEGGGIGEEYGRALIARYGTPYDVFLQPAHVLADTPTIGEKRSQRVGPAAAAKLLRAIGKEE